MKIIFFFLFLIPSLSIGLTFKDGKQVDDNILKSDQKKTSETIRAISGTNIENQILNINFPPYSPNVVKDKYWYGWHWSAQDFNQDGYLDYLYTGTMNPKNVNHVGDNTGGACGGDRCKGEMPGPTLFLGTEEGNYVLSSHLFVDERDTPGQSLAIRNLVADFNNDKILDLFIADHAVGTHKGIRDSYFLSQGDGTWLESSNTHLSNSNYTIFDHGGTVGDIDNDGDMDIVLTELKNQLTCWINDGTGKLNLKTCGSVHAFAIELGDMDGDGDLDIVHAGHESGPSTHTGVVLNDGNGNFTKGFKLPTKILDWYTIPELSLWDLDEDGDLDIVISRTRHLYVGAALEVLENLGNNNFEKQLYVLLDAPSDFIPQHEGNEWNNYCLNILFGDFDNDKDQDILCVSHLEFQHKVVGASILNNEGDMNFKHIPFGEKGNNINFINHDQFKPRGYSKLNEKVNNDQLEALNNLLD